MKTKLFMIATILLLSQTTAIKAQTWEFVNSFSDYLTNVYTQGEDTVYVVGQNGLVAQSPDRGKTWYYQHIITETLNDVYFTSHNIGFIVGTNGTILKTIDAGMNWTSVVSGTTQKLNAISAIDINNIWAVGDKGTVIKSTDGGQIWNAVSITTQTPDFSDIGFKNTKGYIIGNMGSIYQTLDNGNTWTQQTDIEEYTGQEEFVCLSITENKAFILSTNNPSVYQYNNNVWQKYTVPSDEITYFTQFLSDNQGVLTATRIDGFTGYLSSYWVVNVFKTDNGGSSWSSYSYGSNNPISTRWIIGDTNSRIAFVNMSLGYLISGHYMYRLPFVGDINADFTAGIMNQKQDIIGLSQNQNSLIIDNSVIDISNIRIISTLGQIIFQKFIDNKNKIIINTRNFNKGTYIVQVNFRDNTTLSIKWIKQ